MLRHRLGSAHGIRVEELAFTTINTYGGLLLRSNHVFDVEARISNDELHVRMHGVIVFDVYNLCRSGWGSGGLNICAHSLLPIDHDKKLLCYLNRRDYQIEDACKGCDTLRRCSKCDTECTSNFYTMGNGYLALRVTTYKNFGRGESPGDKKWQRHFPPTTTPSNVADFAAIDWQVSACKAFERLPGKGLNQLTADCLALLASTLADGQLSALIESSSAGSWHQRGGSSCD